MEIPSLLISRAMTKIEQEKTRHNNKKSQHKKYGTKCQGPDTNLIVVIFIYFFPISSEKNSKRTKKTIIWNRDSGVKDHLIWHKIYESASNLL